MQTFEAKRWGQMEVPSTPPGTGFRVDGFRAPGPIVLIVQEGTGWVLRPDGDREPVQAKSVVTYNTGDWIEYGSDSGSGCKIDDYWAADFSEGEWAARLAEVFGSEAVQ